MRFHPPSFLLGFASAVVIGATRKRLRPAIVEIGALGIHLGRLGRAVVERQREHAEDLWAEIEDRVKQKARGVRQRVQNGAAHHEPTIAGAEAPSTQH